MSIGLALEDRMCVQRGSSESLCVSLARSEAALCEKLEELGVKEADVVVWQVQGIAWGRWQDGALRLAAMRRRNARSGWNCAYSMKRKSFI